MIKVCGAILVLIGTVGITYVMNGEMRTVLGLKRELIKMLQLLEGEIRHRNLNLPECFTAIADRLSASVSGFLRGVAEELQQREGIPLSTVWRERAKSYFAQHPLCGKELEAFCKFGEEFGFRDQVMQREIIRQYQTHLEEEASEAMKKLREMTRIYNVLGILGGIFIVVILL